MKYVLLFFLKFALFCISFAAHSQRTVLLGRRRGQGLTPPAQVHRDISGVKTKWFEQKLDHFKETENRTWQQKCYVISRNFEKIFKPRKILINFPTLYEYVGSFDRLSFPPSLLFGRNSDRAVDFLIKRSKILPLLHF